MKKIYYGKAVYDNKEINAVIGVLKNESLTLIDGNKVKELERVVSRIFGKKYGLMVNSGSSANLLALSSFKFKKGSEIITPNLTFSTTVAPIYQLGLIPHFVGVEENKFLADALQIEKCINKKTVAIMIPNLLGNIADWERINKIAKKYKLKVIEDSADTIGYTINKKNAGKYSDVVTNSFYASHIINGAGTGGIVCFNDFDLYHNVFLILFVYVFTIIFPHFNMTILFSIHLILLLFQLTLWNSIHGYMHGKDCSDHLSSLCFNNKDTEKLLKTFPWLNFLIENHKTHHKTQTSNFNITFPGADFIMGTYQK